jgi:RNA methyltransferase, TrmH family
MITSPANPLIKHIRKLLRERKEREASGLFFCEGLRVVGEAVQMGAAIECLVIAPELLVSEFGWDIVAEQRSKGTAIEEVSPAVFQEISSKDGPQGVGALIHTRWEMLAEVNPAAGEMWVALDSIQDPGNLGTVLRTADAVGASGLILLDHSTDPYDLTALRASTGAVFSQRMARAPLAEFSAWKRVVDLPLIGTSGSADLTYREMAYPARMALLMGSERQGLQPAHYAICDQVVAIPMIGRSDSLNLSVATGVVLYEIFHQREQAQGH